MFNCTVKTVEFRTHSYQQQIHHGELCKTIFEIPSSVQSSNENCLFSCANGAAIFIPYAILHVLRQLTLALLSMDSYKADTTDNGFKTSHIWTPGQYLCNW